MKDSVDLLHAPGPWSHRYLDANGARLHAVTTGFTQRATPRRVIILLHSFPQHWYAWRRVLAAASETELPMVALDLRGHGASDKPPSRFSVPTLATDVVGVISTLGAREAILVGHGLGGVIARAAAAAEPEAIRHVVTVSSPHPANWKVRRGGLQAKYSAALMAPIVAERGLTRGTTVAKLICDLSAPASPARVAIDSYTQVLRSPFAARCALGQLRWLARARRRPSGRQFLAELERSYWIVPVTEIRGESDAWWDRSAFNSEVISCPAGHFVPEDNPEPILQAITAATSDFR